MNPLPVLVAQPDQSLAADPAVVDRILAGGHHRIDRTDPDLHIVRTGHTSAPGVDHKQDCTVPVGVAVAAVVAVVVVGAFVPWEDAAALVVGLVARQADVAVVDRGIVPSAAEIADLQVLVAAGVVAVAAGSS